MTYESAKISARRAFLVGRLTRGAGALWVPLVVGLLALWVKVDLWLVGAAALASALWLFGSHLMSHRLGNASYAGALIGMVPFGAGALAPQVGHACAGAYCYEFCLGFCVVGGLAAGALAMRYASQSGRPALLLGVAAPVVISSGSLGCGCVGATGVGMMVVGLVLGAALARPRTRPA